MIGGYLSLRSVSAEASLAFQAPVIHFGTKRWVAYEEMLTVGPIEVDAPTRELARLQASYKLGLSVKKVRAHEVSDLKQACTNRRA